MGEVHCTPVTHAITAGGLMRDPRRACVYRGTLLIRNRPTLGPCKRPMLSVKGGS